MIREYIIVLSDKQSKRLIEMSESAGEDDELAHLQQKITEWLKDDSARLEHTEK